MTRCSRAEVQMEAEEGSRRVGRILTWTNAGIADAIVRVKQQAGFNYIAGAHSPGDSFQHGPLADRQGLVRGLIIGRAQLVLSAQQGGNDQSVGQLFSIFRRTVCRMPPFR